ncbi:hypothetical protein GA0115245_143737 [Streptomyces sp. di188]|nr:hypothetical protein GA0115238_109836 [Streptomyces sp. di50b]SCE47816.1 hypothetical protein GA0115245_143737 [Streptomyces sp. di188]
MVLALVRGTGPGDGEQVDDLSVAVFEFEGDLVRDDGAHAVAEQGEGLAEEGLQGIGDRTDQVVHGVGGGIAEPVLPAGVLHAMHLDIGGQARGPGAVRLRGAAGVRGAHEPAPGPRHTAECPEPP